MSESAGLERRYRRLLAWYPPGFRREQEEEMLAVLMAGARQGQRRPGLMESADLIRSAIWTRLRLIGSGSQDRPWADALALFSVVAPLFLLVADILEVALPYHLRPGRRIGFFSRLFGSHPQIGGLPLLSLHGFDIAVGCQVIIAALVLLGLRRMALAAIAASALYWIVARYWIPDTLQLLSTSVYILVAAALLASPGPRRGRHLMNWGHGVVLLVAAAAVQFSTLVYDATSPPARLLAARPSHALAYLVTSVVLAVAAAGLALALKVNWYFLLLLAAMFYPYVMQLAFPTASSDTNLIGHPTPAHLALLYAPPLLLACGVILAAVTSRHSGVLTSPDLDKPGLT
jgi:hypothetical protein